MCSKILCHLCGSYSSAVPVSMLRCADCTCFVYSLAFLSMLRSEVYPKLHSFQKVDQLEPADEEIAEEALDCLMMCLPLTLRSVEQVFQQKGQWFAFFEDLLVVCRNAGIRNRTANVLRVLGNRPVSENSLMDQHLLAYFFNALQHQSRNRPDTCTEAFHLVAA